MVRRQQDVSLHVLTAGQQMAQGGPIGITGKKGQAVPVPDKAQDQGGTVALPEIGARYRPRRMQHMQGKPVFRIAQLQDVSGMEGDGVPILQGGLPDMPHLAAARLAVMQQERLGEGRQQGRDAARVVDVGMAVDDGIQTGTGVAGQQGQQELLPRVPGAGHASGGIYKQGLAVRQAQQLINIIARGYAEVPAVAEDGIFGDATESSVASIQSLLGLPATGAIGPLTWEGMADLAENVLAGSQNAAGQYPGYPVGEEAT